MIEPALALVEFSSIAVGIQAADAMVKRAPIDVIKTGTVQPGKYLVLIGGAVADVEESLAAGRLVGGTSVVDHVYLPQVHPEVVEAIGGGRIGRQRDRALLRPGVRRGSRRRHRRGRARDADASGTPGRHPSAARGDVGQRRQHHVLWRTSDGSAMKFARVIGTVVSTRKVEGLEG